LEWRERQSASSRRCGARLQEQDRPAFQRLQAYLTNTYSALARDNRHERAPDGAAWYAYNVKVHTTTRRTPREIHELGLSEVKRIRAQMDSLIRSTGFVGEFAAFTHMLRTDPKFFYADSATLVRAYRDITKTHRPRAAQAFGRLPRLPYGVSTIPSYSAPSQTTAYYQGALPKRTGRPVLRQHYKLDTRPTWEMEVLTSHEAVPGHHLQIAISQELEGIPEFGATADIPRSSKDGLSTPRVSAPSWDWKRIRTPSSGSSPTRCGVRSGW